MAKAKATLPEVVTAVYAQLNLLEEGDRRKAVASVLAMFGEKPPAESDRGSATGGSGQRPAGGRAGPLVKFLRDCKVADKPGLRFLATAQWLHDKGQSELKLLDVTQAAKNAQQARFSNPSHFLAENIKSGYIEGKASSFFVTVDGREAIGLKDE